MKIGDKIRILRKINKITINELSEYLNISAPTLRKIENNKLFVNMNIVKLLKNNSMINFKEKELLEYYYTQELKKEVVIQAKDEKVFIVIPKDISIAFGLEENKEIYCCYLNNKIILQHEENDDYIFEKKKIFKDRYTFIFFLGQKLKYLQGHTAKLELDLEKKILTILY